MRFAAVHMAAFGTKRRSPQRKSISRKGIKADIARPFTAAARRPSRRARAGTDDPRSALGAHGLCFELSDECGETR